MELLDMLYEMIDDAKAIPFSNDCRLDRDGALDLLDSIRNRFPVELGEAIKIVQNRDQYVADAQKEASRILEQAQAQAQTIVDNAVADANSVRQGSIQYTDDMLKSLQTIMNHTMEGAQGRFDAFMNSMKSSYDIVSSNRKELSSGIITEKEEDATPETEDKNA